MAISALAGDQVFTHFKCKMNVKGFFSAIWKFINERWLLVFIHMQRWAMYTAGLLILFTFVCIKTT